MSDVVITTNKISKRYRIGLSGEFTYLALRDVLANAVKAPIRLFRNASMPSPSQDHIWALKDVSLEVKRGQIVGVVGRNGAGKTTLLKILTRITKPSSGHAQIRGRVGSLLEVGTGFHPELTGRENIYLSGSILGMRKNEINRKFDEIVEFAGIAKFLDTPSKHYSTGMYMRLGFAVAAHLEPEILLVDEVLAVGDLEFQKKCLGKMEDVSRGGRTIVFVSHQMNQIRRLCGKVVWIEGGQVRRIGPTAEVLGAYEAAMTSGDNGDDRQPDAPKTKARFLRWEIVDPRAEDPHLLTSLGPVTLKFVLQVNEAVRKGVHGIEIYNAEGQLIWGTAVWNLSLNPGTFDFVHRLDALPLKPGAYRWCVSVFDEHGRVDFWNCVPELLIGTKPLAHPRDEHAGLLNVPSQFSIRENTG